MEAMDGEMAKLVANRGASHATHKETGFGAHRSPLAAYRSPIPCPLPRRHQVDYTDGVAV